jgi:hypothetical protein
LTDLEIMDSLLDSLLALMDYALETWMVKVRDIEEIGMELQLSQ